MSLTLDIGPHTLVRALLGPTEDGMDVLKEFLQNPWRIYTDPTMRPLVVRTGSTFTYGPVFPSSVTDTGHGFNTIRLHGEEALQQLVRPGATPGDVASSGAWRFKRYWGGWIALRNRTYGPSRTSPTQFVGVGCGYPTSQIEEYPPGSGTYQLVGPPWPDEPDGDFVQLRIRGDLMRWELVAGCSANAVQTVVPLVGTEAPVEQVGQIVHFEWLPAGHPQGPRLRGFVNGVLGAEINDPGLLPGGGIDSFTASSVYNHWLCCGGDPTGGPDDGHTGYVTGDIGPLFGQEFAVKDAS
jgi:hypothetical protein